MCFLCLVLYLRPNALILGTVATKVDEAGQRDEYEDVRICFEYFGESLLRRPSTYLIDYLQIL